MAYRSAKIEDVMDRLAKPMYVWRMSKAIVDSYHRYGKQSVVTPAMRKSATTRYLNALDQIGHILDDWRVVQMGDPDSDSAEKRLLGLEPYDG